MNVAGLHSVSSRLSPCKPVSDRIQLVTVVPMFAPMMTPAACDSRMMPELTKPTTITVVADEDWIIAVTRRAEQHGFNLAFGQAFQNALQLAAGSAGQPFAHHVHAV